MKITLDADERFGKIDHVFFFHPQHVKSELRRRFRTDARQSAEGVDKFGYRFGIIQSAAPLINHIDAG